MGGSLFQEGAFDLPRLAFGDAREALGNLDVNTDAKRTPVVALPATPQERGLIGKVGTLRPTVAISVAVARPYLASISRQVRRTIFEPWRAGLA